jgi:gliding motility-associated-like protein
MKRLLLFSALNFLSFLLTAQNNFINQDSVFYQSSDCVGGVSVCIDSIVYDNIGNYKFTLDGAPYTGTFTACREDTIHLYNLSPIFDGGETGPFKLKSWFVNGVKDSIPLFGSIKQLVDSMLVWDPDGKWQFEPISSLIYGYPTKGKTYSEMIIEGQAKLNVNFIGYNTGFDFVGLKFRVPAGRHQFIVEEITSGLKDTVKVTAACVKTDILRETMVIGTNRAYCLNFSELLGQPQLATFKNFCSKTTTKVTFDSLYNFCVGYTGRATGTDTACIRVCDQYGVCDTTYLYITAQPNLGRFYLFQDTITIGLNRQKCNLNIPTGTIGVFQNDCPTRSGREASFVLDAATRCVTYTGLAVGTDTACIRVCNTDLPTPMCDTTHIYITGQAAGVPATGGSFTFKDTITVGLNRQKCNLTIPTGTINVFQNYCTGSSSSKVTFALDAATRCVTYTGLVVGTDTACVRVCNTSNVCDTTKVIITAIPVVVAPPVTGGSFTFKDTITVGLNRQKCNLTIPAGTINVFQNYCTGSSGSKVTFALDAATRCVTYTGLVVGTDTACVRVCNTSNVCDTTKVIITAIPVVVAPPVTGGSFTFKDTITVGLSRVKCNLTVPTGTINVFENYCFGSSGTKVFFGLDPLTNCVTYTGAVVGTDTVCLRVCNTSNVCDTNKIIITTIPVVVPPSVVSSFIFKDTITEGSSNQKCNVTIPTGTINVFQNYCLGKSGTKVSFVLDTVTRCVKYTGLLVGTDTACVSVCNTANVCDTTTFIIETKPLQTGTGARRHVFNDTISVGTNRTKCDFVVPANAKTIQNYCATSSGSKINFVVNPTTLCVTYTGVSVGTDTACIRVCDAIGICDTTTVIVRGLATTVVTLNLTPSVDTVNLKTFERTVYCPDPTEFGATPITQIKLCKPALGDKAIITLDTTRKCVVLTGLKAGIDTFCIVLCSSSGACDTTTLFVKVSTETLKPTTRIDSFTIKIGELKVYCPDTLELLSANIASIGSCAPQNFKNTTVNFNAVTKCLETRGIKAGKDTACVIICNALGLCDTTKLYITVTSDSIKPVSSIERITLKLGKDSLFTNIDSTQIFGSVDDINDVCPGKNGLHARMVLNKTLKNVAIRGVGVGIDTMCLLVCNTALRLCDTTTIIVTVVDTVRLSAIQAYNDFDTTRLGRSITFLVYKNDSLNKVKPAYLAVIRAPLKGKADTISFRDGIIKYTAGKTPQSCGLDSFRYRVCLDTAKTVCSEATVVIDVKCAEGLKAFTAMSPNGDGKNDYFYLDGLQKYPENTLYVYNRWGNEVYKVKNYQNDWQGTWKGKDLPDGTYFYWLRNDATGEILMTGNLQILR